TAHAAAVQGFEVSAALREPAEKPVREIPFPDSVAAASGLFFHGAAPSSPVSEEAAPELSISSTQEQAAEIDLSSEWEEDLSVETPGGREQVARPVEEDPNPSEVEAPAAASPDLDEPIEH